MSALYIGAHGGGLPSGAFLGGCRSSELVCILLQLGRMRVPSPIFERSMPPMTQMAGLSMCVALGLSLCRPAGANEEKGRALALPSVEKPLRRHASGLGRVGSSCLVRTRDGVQRGCQTIGKHLRHARETIREAENIELVTGLGWLLPYSFSESALDRPALSVRLRYLMRRPKWLLREGLAAWRAASPKRSLTLAFYGGTLWSGFAFERLAKRNPISIWGFPLMVPGGDWLLGGLRNTFSPIRVWHLLRDRAPGRAGRIAQEMFRSPIPDGVAEEKAGKVTNFGVNTGGANVGLGYIGRPDRGHAVLLNVAVPFVLASLLAEAMCPGAGAPVLEHPWLRNAYAILGVQYWKKDPDIEAQAATVGRP